MSDATLRMILLGDDRTMSKAVKSAGEHVAGVGKMIGGLATAGILGFAGMGAAATVMGVKTAAMNEQAQVAFTTLLGSSKKAQAYLAELNKFAANTPFDLPGLIDSSRLLLGVGMNAKQVIPTLTAWGDAAGALGIQQDGFNRAMIAVSQSLSAGRINAGDMNQIVQAGIPIWKLMSEATGKTVPQLRKLSSEGKLLSKDVLPLLNKQMEKDYGGSMAKQSKTLNGLWSTLMDTFSQGMAKAIVPLIPMLKNGLAGATNAVSVILPKVAAGLASFIAGMRNGTGPGGVLVAVLKRLWAILVTTGQAIANVTRWIIENKAAVGTFVGIIGTVVTALKIWRTAQLLLNLAMRANVIGIIITAIALLAAGLVYAWQHSETFRNVVTFAFNAVKNGAIALALLGIKSFHFLLNAWLTVAGGILHAAAWAFGWVPGLGPKLQGAAAGFDHFKDSVNHTLSQVETNLTIQLNTGAAKAAADSLARYVRSRNYTAVVTVMHPQLAKLTLPGHAAGGRNLPAGWSVVGEQGPEIMYVPGGSDIYSNSESAAMLRGGLNLTVNLRAANGQLIQQELLRFKRQRGGNLGLA